MSAGQLTKKEPRLSKARNVPPGRRSLRLAAAPTWTLVIASRAPRPALEALLEAVLPDCESRNIEVVVARDCAAQEMRDLADRFGRVLFMPAPDRASLRQLRAVGLSAAEGDIVRVVEDDGTPDLDWIQRVPPASD